MTHSLDAPTIQREDWARRPDFRHGTTTRAALPQTGKAPLAEALAQARAVGLLGGWRAVVGADQVHGAHIETLTAPPNDATECPETDALVTTLEGVALAIRTADCLPVVGVDFTRRIVGVAHCGWRGLRAGLAGRLVEAMAAAGADVDGLEGWLGPCIQPERYEVGPELVREFTEAFPDAAVSPDGIRLDLPAVARWQLERAGVAPGRIVSCGECTLGRPERWHSWRGQGERAGRMITFAGFAKSRP